MANTPTATVAVHLDTTSPPVEVRTVHGVNGAGVSGNYWLDLTPWLRHWRVPMVRLHDATFDAHDTVDLHHLFPDPSADPDDAGNYRFELTDLLLTHLREAGLEIYFRLGESIEHQPLLTWNTQQRWDVGILARVCANIVRHYNQGWADGHHWGIRYWEFWNEPHGPKNWDGTPKEFFERYTAVARAVKQVDPNVRIGTAGFGIGFVEPESAWGQGLVRLATEGVPIDFVSWHAYLCDWATLVSSSRAVRELLDRIGLQDAESHLGEWGFRPVHGPDGTRNIFAAYRGGRYDHVARLTAEMSGPSGLAHVLGCLLLLQELPVDLAQYYTANTSPRWGLFDASGQPTRRGLAFDIFAELLRVGASRWPLNTDRDDLVVSAFRLDGGLRVLVASLSEDIDAVQVSMSADGPLKAARAVVHDGVDRLAVLPPEVIHRDGITEFVVQLSGPGVAIVDLAPGESRPGEPTAATRSVASGDW